MLIFFQDSCNASASKGIATAQKTEVSWHFKIGIIDVLWAGEEIYLT